MTIDFSENAVGVTIGCDLGKEQDYTAICVAESQLIGETIRTKPYDHDGDGVYTESPPTVGLKTEYFLIRWLERAMLGTDYTKIANRLADLHDRMLKAVREVNKKRLEVKRQGGPGQEIIGEPEIYIDVTGLGGPFVDFLRKEHPHLRIVAVSITSGDKDLQKYVSEGYDVLHVGKEALVGRLQVLLGAERIGLPKTPEAKVLGDEMKTYRRKLSKRTGHASYEAEEGSHDDLVVATALAVWKRARTWQERVQLW